jgi:hypothetical protein
MGKFGEEARQGRSAAAFLPEAEKVSPKQAAIRTAHTLVGTGVLAAAVVFALRIRQRAIDGSEIEHPDVSTGRFTTGRVARLEPVGSQRETP